MRDQQGITRRRFLLSLVWVGQGLGLSLVLRETVACGTAASVSIDLGKLLGDTSSSLMVGDEYLRQVPEEGDTDQLLELIFPGLGSASRPPSPIELEQSFVATVLDDFETNRIVKLREWMLSRAEARLCAIAALLASADARPARLRTPPPSV
jgi:hypothetical protein